MAKKKRSRKKNRENKIQPRSRSCKFWVEQYEDALVNCATCVKWNRDTRRCRDEEEVVQKYEDTSMIENLMRHDSFTRGRGGIRQVRRGL